MARRTLGLALAGLAFGLAIQPEPAASQENGITTRRIWKGDPGQFCCGNTLVSRDGRYVPGWDVSTGDLAYLDMMEDRWVSVTSKGTWDENDSFSLNGMFSPDGRWLAHTWSNADRQAGTTVAELRLDRVDGGEHRVILSGPAAAPLDWTPDGTMVLAQVRRVLDGGDEAYLATQGRESLDQLTLIPVDGGEERILQEYHADKADGRMALTASPVGLNAARVSPDGRWVAYQRYEEGTIRADIFLISIDGGDERPLVTGNGNDLLLGWLPDGSGILFHSGREIRQGIWRLPIRDGQPQGEPEYVRGDVFGMEPFGVGPKGVYYLIHTELPQVYTAEIDFENGELLSAPAPIRNPGSGSASGSPAWSPDGRQLAYFLWTERNHADIAVHSLETGEMKIFPQPTLAQEKVTWGSDPRNLVIHGGLLDGTGGVFRFDLQSSELSLVLSREEAGVNLERGLKRDGRSVMRRVADPEGGARIEVLDLETDEVRTLLRSVTGFSWVWGTSFPGANQYALWMAGMPGADPDGNAGRARLIVINADGTGERTLWEGETASIFVNKMDVTSDGKYVLLQNGGGDGTDPVWIVGVATGEVRFLKTPSGEEFRDDMRFMVLQPNGSRVAFNGGKHLAEIWVMEGIW